MSLFKKYVSACMLVTSKHVLHGVGAALCSVSNYLDFALNTVCNEIAEDSGSKDKPKTESVQKDMN
jgi:hypothetical protein